MIVYRDQRFRASPQAQLVRLYSDLEQLQFNSAGAHDGAIDALIRAGMLESAVADELFVEADGLHPLDGALRGATVALSHMLWHSWRAAPDQAEGWRVKAMARLATIADRLLPRSVEMTVPEGFAYYALFPEAYLEAARRCRQELGGFTAICIGLRSIGTTLSALVAAALAELGCQVQSCTVRPRGHPFARHPIVTPALEQLWGEDREARFLLIDEGPGISGSSLAGTAELLNRLGVSDNRILLFPGWRTDGATLRSAEARAHWGRHRQYVVSFEELSLEYPRMKRLLPAGRTQELSAGAWRHLLYSDPDQYPAVQPQHERRKFLVQPEPTSYSGSTLLSFAGLGRRSAPILRRAQQLSEAGYAPPVHEISNGFLIRSFVAGTPVRPPAADDALLDTVAGYLAHLSCHHPAEPSVSGAHLNQMAEVNIAEGLGQPWADRFRSRLREYPGSTCEVSVALDGRMLAHEWIQMPDGYLKTDAFDHHDDHFFPGCQDIAWDLAAAAYELELDREGQNRLIERYRRLSGDQTISLRLPLYGAHYLAYRMGYCTLATEVLAATADGARFGAAAQRYARLLRRELSHPNISCNV
jgi:hypothetical protein